MSGITLNPSIIVNDAYLGPSTAAFSGVPMHGSSMVVNDTRTGAKAGAINLLPNIDLSAIDEVTFEIVIRGITGSPTSGQLTAKIQTGALHSGLTSSSATFNFSSPNLVDLTSEQKAAMMVGGDFPSPLASFDSAITVDTPIVIVRTVKDFGSFCNLQLDASTLNGGTNPTFRISVVLIQKIY